MQYVYYIYRGRHRKRLHTFQDEGDVQIIHNNDNNNNEESETPHPNQSSKKTIKIDQTTLTMWP